jgi:hypothetical protein
MNLYMNRQPSLVSKNVSLKKQLKKTGANLYLT